MSHGGDKGIGANHHIIPDFHRGDIQDGHIVVGEEILPNGDVQAVIALKVGTNAGIFPRGPQQLPNHRLPGSLIVLGHGV